MLKIGTITINKRRPAIKNLLYISFISIVLLTVFVFQKDDVIYVPIGLPPTETTIVKHDMEDIKAHLDKNKWLDLVHSAAPGTDWKAIEAKNNYQKYSDLLNNGHLQNRSNGVVSISDGNLIGQWSERGSNNQAGSITQTDYDPYEKKLYAISSGGSLWKGDINGLNWEVFNDQLRFDPRFLKIIPRSNQASLILTSINGIPYTFNGDEWLQTTGINNNRLITKDLVSINNGEDLFFLGQESKESHVSLFYSDNNGQSFSKLRNFTTTHLHEIAITGKALNDEMYILERTTNVRSKIYKWESHTNKLNLVNNNSFINFGNSSHTNIQSGHIEGELFLYDANNVLLKSVDSGENWNLVSQLPVTPWEDGLFISPSNSNKMLIPSVEAHRSNDQGRTWELVNEWKEYYENPSVKLHADIMHISEYQDNGLSFIIVASHGGLNISYDNGEKFSNIGLNNLNVGQYYSVKTYPKDNRFLFTGSQDQGIQRTLLFEEGTGNFTQMYSGDYGHLQFTNNNQSLWTVFPGGTVLYYKNPIITNEPTMVFGLKYANQNVWLPPIIKSPYHDNSVILAGGKNTFSQGSHLIELQVSDLGNLTDEQWPFDFSTSGGTLSYAAFNNFSSSQVYAITTNGKFYKSNDKGESFTKKNNGLVEAHNFYGSKILCSKKDRDLLFIGGSGYDNSPIYISQDGGESFEDMQVNLPSTTVHDLELDETESFLFAATESGPYVYIFKESKWFDLAKGEAPNQRYWDVEYLEDIQLVRFATYGRGIWDLKLSYLNDAPEIDIKDDIAVFPNPTSDYVSVNFENYRFDNIKILNSKGELLFQHKMNALNNFDVSNFSNGVYYIIFESENKFIIKNFIKI